MKRRHVDALQQYPHVLGESETLDQVLAGRSLARYGDGELKMCEGSSIKSQKVIPALTQRLRDILLDSGECLVGIPNIHSDTPKPRWQEFAVYSRLLAARPYVSAFISRPDSAPWIDTDEYWARVEALWVGRDVTLVRGKTKSLVADDLVGAQSITEIVAPPQHAWSAYDELLERIGTPGRVLICLGPTATVMAVDLCRRGVHAVDLGHIGMFLRKHRRGEVMSVTPQDKSA